MLFSCEMPFPSVPPAERRHLLLSSEIALPVALGL
jgi:hypothetical protein